MRQLKITKQVTNRETASLDKYLQEIGKVDLITADEEVELAQRIKAGDQIALEKLTKANLRFVVSVAKQYQNQGLTLPDLILIDGGKGQYSSAKEVLDELGLHDLPMIAIAKGKFRNSGDETFFYNGKSYKFEKNDPTLFFMQRLRDEAHRFAITSHRAKRAKGLSKSLLDQIDGIGAVRKRALLNHFGSARSVESASFDEIKSVEGVEEKVAKKIYNFFHE